MAFANFKEDGTRQFHAIPRTGQRDHRSSDRTSDVWPDFSTEVSDDRIAELVEKNRPSIILWEAVRAVAVSVGMVICLMAALNLLGLR